MVTIGLLAAAAISSLFMTARSEIVPNRLEFSSFPLQHKEWQGNRIFLEKIFLDALKLDDYVLADFINGKKIPVNLYAAYYVSQKAGESAHSPRSCIPGGGWQIKQISKYAVNNVMFKGMPLQVNRLIIQKGEQKLLVYYWFQQRGRIITNEYMVKWYLFWDALTRNRTDGALVRLTTPVLPNEDILEADKRLASFSDAVSISLKKYIPD